MNPLKFFSKSFLWIVILVFVFQQKSSAINPVKGHQLNPDSLKINLAWTEYMIFTKDSVEVCMWHIKSAPEKKKNISLVFSYGDNGNMGKWIMHATVFANAGYDVFMYDYRGYGKSGYIYIEPLALYYDEFIKDLAAVVQKARTLAPNQPLGLLSFSMGTIIANVYMQENEVDFAIHEGYIHNPVVISNKAFDEQRIILEIPPSAYGYELMSKNIKTPMLFFAGTEDEFSKLFYVENYVSQRKNRKLIAFHGGHLQAFQKLIGNGFGSGFLQETNQFIASLKLK